jgi:hypothetical protein
VHQRIVHLVCAAALALVGHDARGKSAIRILLVDLALEFIKGDLPTGL